MRLLSPPSSWSSITTSVGSAQGFSGSDSRTLVDIHRRPMRVRQEGIDFVPRRIARDRMRSLFGSDGLQVVHVTGIKAVNDPGVTDGDIQMAKGGVQEEH